MPHQNLPSDLCDYSISHLRTAAASIPAIFTSYGDKLWNIYYHLVVSHGTVYHYLHTFIPLQLPYQLPQQLPVPTPASPQPEQSDLEPTPKRTLPTLSNPSTLIHPQSPTPTSTTMNGILESVPTFHGKRDSYENPTEYLETVDIVVEDKDISGSCQSSGLQAIGVSSSA